MFSLYVFTGVAVAASAKCVDAETLVLGYLWGAVRHVPGIINMFADMLRSMDCIYLGQKYGSPLGYDRWCQVRDL